MRLIYPVKPFQIFQKFGQNLLDYGQFGMKGHNGLDLRATHGQEVYAAHDGDLGFDQETEPGTGQFKGYGINARIFFVEDSIRWEPIYGHLLAVGTPGPVKAGDVIAYADNTGFSTGDHLHFGLRQWQINGPIINYDNGYKGAIDPSPYLNMTNAKLIKIGSEVGYWFPSITPDGLKSQAANVGEVLPEKTDGSVDFDKVTFDHVI